ncbi:hypothetical protein AC579_1455 [Pseudocercospora musae]|uniref:Uncharacterized protein n=1 Tax=Pseudocercospora musae TaxID=113226 RepID=A0A139IMP2_9PEZI|nr:hypothetical protein AC579_1455 [Pseudocercospora musae]
MSWKFMMMLSPFTYSTSQAPQGKHPKAKAIPQGHTARPYRHIARPHRKATSQGHIARPYCCKAILQGHIVARPYRKAISQGYIARPYRKAILLQGHIARPYRKAIPQGHIARLQRATFISTRQRPVLSRICMYFYLQYARFCFIQHLSLLMAMPSNCIIIVHLYFMNFEAKFIKPPSPPPEPPPEPPPLNPPPISDFMYILSAIWAAFATALCLLAPSCTLP